MKPLFFGIALCGFLSCTPAGARDGAWYVGGDFGGMVVENQPLDNLFGLRPELDHGFGFDTSAFVGYDLGAFRLEAEVAYKRAAPELLNVNGIPFAATGDSHVWSFMGTGSVNLNPALRTNLPFDPFVGIGVGVAQIHTNLVTLGRTDINDSDAAFAWQAVAGLRQAVKPDIDLFMKYRFFNCRTHWF